jgi:hypothetical protein
VAVTTLFGRTTPMALILTAVALVFLLSARSTAELSRICQSAGGKYTAEGCDGSTPAQHAARDWCETHGGVYLAGQDYCAMGHGGP